MNDWQAKKLAKYHKFTKLELYKMLEEALDTYQDDYWKKPNKVNRIFDNGSYFNSCRGWVGYQKGINDNEIEKESISYRVLQCFGTFSKIQLPEKNKIEVKIQRSEIPKL